jgi:GDP-4-dehydro-6-deoxy-D-mannose reductase
MITGAQGFLGRYLVAQMLVSGSAEFIVGLGRSPRNDEFFTHTIRRGAEIVPAPIPRALIGNTHRERYQYVPLDLRNRKALESLVDQFAPTVVFHLASGLRGDAEGDLRESTLHASEALYEVVGKAQCRIERLVLASSAAVYGGATVLPISEASLCQPVDPYGMSKLAAEQAARRLAEERGIAVVVARLFNLIGPGQDERHVCGRLASRIAAVAKGSLPPTLEVGDLESTRDFIDVRDAARALVILGSSGSPAEVYNVSVGKETKVGLVLETLIRLAKVQDLSVSRGYKGTSPISRHLADTSRLRHLGFAEQYDLSQSLTDLLDYYLELHAEYDRMAHVEG